MLGNFSFGDYFKAEACAWGLRARHRGLRHRRGPAVGHGVRDRRRGGGIWRTSGSRRPDRAARQGGQLLVDPRGGPGGPVQRDLRGPRARSTGPTAGPTVDEERFIEIWNLVFMQDEVDGDAEVVRELPAKNIDTGSGARARGDGAAGRRQRFETDLFRPLARGRPSRSRAGARRGRARRRLAQGHRGARPRHDLPDRRRGPAVERGPRLHPAPDAPPRGLPRPAARHRGRRHADRWSTS